MAIKIFTPWKAEVLSFNLREAYAGILEPGVYRGYDTMRSGSSANEYVIEHTWRTGYRKTQIDNTREAEISGMLVLPNGMTVHDNDDVTLTLTAVTGATSRTDVLLGNLLYLETSPGATFNYSVEENVNPDTYVQSSPGTQTIIGFITITESSFEWARNETPNLGGKPDMELPDFTYYARRNLDNSFIGINRFSNHVAFKSLIQKQIREINQINEDGYILINGDTYYSDGVEFIYDLQGETDVEIWGFKYSTMNFGNNSDTHLIPGTTIRVRFINVGAGCKFKKYINQKGFWISADMDVNSHILYTMRIEATADINLAGFAISPLINPSDLVVINDQITDLNQQLINHIQQISNIESYFVVPESPWTPQLLSNRYVYRDYFGNVRINISVYKAPVAFNGNIFTLPQNFRPGNMIEHKTAVASISGSNSQVLRSVLIGFDGSVGFTDNNSPFVTSLKLDFSFNVNDAAYEP